MHGQNCFVVCISFGAIGYHNTQSILLDAWTKLLCTLKLRALCTNCSRWTHYGIVASVREYVYLYLSLFRLRENKYISMKSGTHWSVLANLLVALIYYLFR
jgi:hypothetical protein